MNKNIISFLIKKRIYLFSVFLLFIILFTYFNLSLISKRSKVIDDRHLTTLVQTIDYPLDQNFDKVLANEKRVFTFTAKHNNLGIISFLINNYKKKNTDQVWFRLKEKDSENWIYQEKYPTEKMSEDYYYTFGFPSITDSKGKEYLIEFESISGGVDDSIAIHHQSSFFVAKYSYPKSYLIKNSNEIISFVGNKIKIASGYLTLLDINNIFSKSLFLSFVIPLTFFIILRPFFNKIKENFLIINKRKFDVYFYFKKYIKSSSFLVELLLVFTPIILLLDFAFFSPLTSNINFSFFFLLNLIFINLCYLYVLIKVISLLTKSNLKKLIHPVLIPLIGFTALRSLFLDAVPRWDSAVYYKKLLDNISVFDFSFDSFLAFNWFRHPAMGFGLISSIFQFLTPDNIFMLNIGNLILGVLAILGFYFISIYLFGTEKKWEVLLLTTLFSINPLFFSVSTSFVPDYGVLVFFLIALGSFFHKRHLLSSFFFLLMIFSKETGAYSYALFIIFYLFTVLFKRLSKVKTHHLVNFILAVLPGLIFTLYMIYTKGAHWKAGKTVTVNGNCLFCFSFQPTHFIENLKVMLVLNFSWILTLTAAVASLAYLLKRKLGTSIKDKVKNDEFKSIVLVFLGFVIFFIFYVTYVIPSYMLFPIGLLIIIFYYSLLKLINNSKVRILFLIVLSILFLIQNFIHIDLVSSTVFGTFKFGNYKGLKIGSEYFGDGFIYNTQHLYIDRLIKKFNIQFNVSENDTVVMKSNGWENFYLGAAGYSYYLEEGSFNKTFINENSFRPKLSDQTPSEHIYYLVFPWLEDEEVSLDVISRTYIIGEKIKIEINGYWLNAYNLTRK